MKILGRRVAPPDSSGLSESEEISESVKHDFSTSKSGGIVPLSHRRPLLHFWALWMTFSAGMSFVFVGTQIYAGGHSFLSTVAILATGIGCYFAYAMFAAYLGSRTGQTTTLLTRSIFGTSGSIVVSLLTFVAALGFVAFQANLLAQIWDGLYGWGHVELLTVLLAAIMVFNNLFGFIGISAYARYIVTPLLVLWIYFMIGKGVAVNAHNFTSHLHHAVGLGFFPAVGVVIGFCMWGNEPDVWRYGKPQFGWPSSAYIFGLVFGLGACGIAGWLMADLAQSTNFSTIILYITHYSLFGVLALAFIIGTIGQIAINDGNYYEAINALQNIVGDRWHRLVSCAITAGVGALFGWLVNYVLVNGFATISAFEAITVATATSIMCVDHFILPRLLKISRPLLRVPSWRETGVVNIPAVAALLCAVIFGAFATGTMPGFSASHYWGLASLETWVLGVVLYLVFSALACRIAPNSKNRVFGFSVLALEDAKASETILDIAIKAEQDN